MYYQRAIQRQIIAFIPTIRQMEGDKLADFGLMGQIQTWL